MLAIWSFGVSPYGLSLSEEDLWSLTPREYAELRKQWKRHHDRAEWQVASLQATLYNANFRGEGDAAYLPEDFMGTGDRAKRQAERQREKMEVMRLKSQLGRIDGRTKPEGLPEWCN